MSTGKAQVVQVGPGPRINLTPLGFHLWAVHFLEASRRCSTPEGQGFTPVPSYLLCRSLELAFKAYLLSQGWTLKNVKDALGHDLQKGREHASRAGLWKLFRTSRLESAALETANGYYRDKALEYFFAANAGRGFNPRPNLEVLDAYCSRLLGNIQDVVKRSAQ